MTPLPIRFHSFLYRTTNNNGLIAQRKACAIPFNNKAPWTQTMQTKPHLRLFKTYFSANEKNSMVFLKDFQDPCSGVLKQITHCFCWECAPPFLFYLSWCFAEGMSFLRQKQWVSSWTRWEKQKLDYVNIVWKWCDQIPTWWNQAEIIPVGKTNGPYSKRIGEPHQGQTAPHFLWETNSRKPRLI